jgi:hypothetical protein
MPAIAISSRRRNRNRKRNRKRKRKGESLSALFLFLISVGWTGFEPATPCTPYKCATGLRHHPNKWAANLRFFV